MSEIDKTTVRLLRKLAAAIAADNEAIAKLEAHKEALVLQLSGIAPWAPDVEDRDAAHVDFPGLGTVRRVWVKGKRTFDRVKAIQRWSASEVDACYTVGEETSRVTFYAEREKPEGR